MVAKLTYWLGDGSGRQRWKIELFKFSSPIYNLGVECAKVIFETQGGNLWKYLSSDLESKLYLWYNYTDYTGKQNFYMCNHGSYWNILQIKANKKGTYLSTNNDGTIVDLYDQDDGSGRQRWILERLD